MGEKCFLCDDTTEKDGEGYLCNDCLGELDHDKNIWHITLFVIGCVVVIILLSIL